MKFTGFRFHRSPMRVTIRTITSNNKTYPYTVYLQENILHLFKRKHIFYADHEFSFLKKTSKKGKETTYRNKGKENMSSKWRLAQVNACLKRKSM